MEDNPTNARLTEDMLHAAGFTTALASDGESGLVLARQQQPDVVLTDLQMPGMDGLALTRRLKADKRTASIPVVALTGHALAGISEGARRAGCDAFVTKPCLPEDLVKELRKILDAASSTSTKKVRRSGKHA